MWIYILLIFTTVAAIPTLAVIGFIMYLRQRGRRFILDGDPLVIDMTGANGFLDYGSAGMHLNFEVNGDAQVAVRVLRGGVPKWVHGEGRTTALRMAFLGENFDLPSKTEGE